MTISPSKICKKCLLEKPISEFHIDKNMKYGCRNICKPCACEAVRLRHKEKMLDKNYVESERLRAKEKYKRLNYKEKYRSINTDKVILYRHLHRDLKIPKGLDCHHWSYNDIHLKDVILLDRCTHKRLHNLITLEENTKIFKVKTSGLILDTRELHENFIESCGFKIHKIEND